MNTEGTSKPSVDPHTERLVMNEHRRRVERIQRLAAHISEYAGYLQRDVENIAPDDFKTPIDVPNYARDIADDASAVRRLVGELDAIRDTAGLFLGGVS